MLSETKLSTDEEVAILHHRVDALERFICQNMGNEFKESNLMSCIEREIEIAVSQFKLDNRIVR